MLLTLLSVCFLFVGCNAIKVTIHIEGEESVVWDPYEESFDSFIKGKLVQKENFKPFYYFDPDCKVRADVNALTAEKLEKEKCDNLYVKWEKCWHDYEDSLDNRREPTCSVEGKESDYICTVCGHITEGVSISCIPHSYDTVIYVAPTCTSKGVLAHKECKNCHYITDMDEEKSLKVADTILPALGHDLTHFDKKEPKCNEPGYDAYECCNRCDYSTYKELTLVI